MKGLPLAYQKDMQEDKEGTIDALSALLLSVSAMTGMVRDMVPDAARMREAAEEGYATATDLADWLVVTLKLPFREAHRVTGQIVAKAASEDVPLHQFVGFVQVDCGDRRNRLSLVRRYHDSRHALRAQDAAFFGDAGRDAQRGRCCRRCQQVR
jgi:argininosuccinate lyase